MPEAPASAIGHRQGRGQVGHGEAVAEDGALAATGRIADSIAVPQRLGLVPHQVEAGEGEKHQLLDHGAETQPTCR